MNRNIQRLLLAELRYFKYELFIIFGLLLTYTIFVILDISVFEGTFFLNRYFWSAFIGLGSFTLIYTMWARRTQEKRDRLIILIPVPIKYLSLVRICLLIAPLFMIVLYLLIVHLIFIDSWVEHTIRIIAQIGLYFIAMPFLLFMFDLWFSFSYRTEKYLLPALLFVIVAGVMITIFVLFQLLIPFYRTIFSAGEEITFYLWGLFLNLLLIYSFKKRRSYL